MIQERDDDSVYFVRLLIDKQFLDLLNDESLKDINFSQLFNKLPTLAQNETFIDIVMHEIDLKFGNRSAMIDEDSLEKAEALFKQSIGSRGSIVLPPDIIKSSFNPSIKISDAVEFEKMRSFGISKNTP